MRNRENIGVSPLSRYTIEDCANMPVEEFDRLLREHGAYLRKKYAILSESNEPEPEFNSIEELDAYYHCIPFEDAVNNIYKMFGFNDSNQ